MKLQGFVGTGSGKMGASVFVVRNGVQIVRQYQGKVDNPKSVPQVQQRAKLKLTSQVSAALGAVILGFRNLEPGVSQRNAFVADLFKREVVTYDTANSKAVMNVSAIALTNSNLALGGVSSVSATGASVSATIFTVPEFNVPGALLTAVVLRPVENGGVEYIGSSVVNAASQISLTVNTVSDVRSSDRLVLYMSRPIESENYVSYMNAIGNATTGDITLDTVVRTYARSLVFSRSINLAITIA